VCQGRSRPGCHIVGSVTIVRLTTEANSQSSLHCVVMMTGVMSDSGHVNLLSDAGARRYDSGICSSKMSKNGHFTATNS